MATSSILMPTWKTTHLNFCFETLRRHPTREHQLVVHANEGSDGTRAWLRDQGVAHIASDTNVGICHAVDVAVETVRGDYVLYLSNHMVLAPS